MRCTVNRNDQAAEDLRDWRERGSEMNPDSSADQPALFFLLGLVAIISW